MKITHVHEKTTRNGNSSLKRINKITKNRCSLKKGLHSDSSFVLSIKCFKCLLTLGSNGVMTIYLF